MARQNKLKLAIQLLENKLAETNKLLNTEVDTRHYGRANELHWYGAGIIEALSLVKVCSGQEEKARL